MCLHVKYETLPYLFFGALKLIYNEALLSCSQSISVELGTEIEFKRNLMDGDLLVSSVSGGTVGHPPWLSASRQRPRNVGEWMGAFIRRKIFRRFAIQRKATRSGVIWHMAMGRFFFREFLHWKTSLRYLGGNWILLILWQAYFSFFGLFFGEFCRLIGRNSKGRNGSTNQWWIMPTVWLPEDIFNGNFSRIRGTIVTAPSFFPQTIFAQLFRLSHGEF